MHCHYYVGCSFPVSAPAFWARQVVVAGSAIGEMAMHFIEQAGLMAVRIPSKFDLRRFCRCARQQPIPVISGVPVRKLG